ncbi:MAG: hypothetical protein KIH08_06235 [Candidatus Freyarchaeota archaeon]|nr:hypothetical protein [Candidatus Jordarchaeia archaeon]MBS7267697.1 hypothetical protein [Candidatus Jordarchaeia archaeon]MBS7278835.1 hypothetical protein [Candidatus Jordarchaeia archaeon]
MQMKPSLLIISVTLLAVSLLAINLQGQNLVPFILPLLLVSSFGVGIAGITLWRKHVIPVKALASLENIIVDHMPSGVTLWAFDFAEMQQHTIIVSGFISAVKDFMFEMRKGDLKKLETEFGTFIKEDGDFLTVTCITSGNTKAEEEWIRRRLQTFLRVAEIRHWNNLMSWAGDTSIFEESFFQIISSVINMNNTFKLQKQRISNIRRKKARLYAELKNLDSEIDTIEAKLKNGKISEEEFEVRKTRIKNKYKRIREYYINTCLLLSRVTRKPIEEVEASREIEKIRSNFLKLKSEIDELHLKKCEGTITPIDIKNKEKIQKELIILIENLEKFM